MQNYVDQLIKTNIKADIDYSRPTLSTENKSLKIAIDDINIKDNGTELFHANGIELFLNPGNFIRSGFKEIDYVGIEKIYFHPIRHINKNWNFEEVLVKKKKTNKIFNKIFLPNIKLTITDEKSKSEINYDELFISIDNYGRRFKKIDLLTHKIIDKDRAIVTNIKGTTRDILSNEFIINSNRFEIFDTAGQDLSAIAGDKESKGAMLQGTPLDMVYWKYLGGLDKIQKDN